MCIGKAFIVRKGQRLPDYLRDSNDHKPLVEKFNLKDDRLIDRKFVRLEAHPLNCITSTNPKDWEIVVDEQGTLPSWFEDKIEDWKYKCLKILTEKIVLDWVKNGVGGSLDLRGTAVKTLGPLKSVGGYLDLQDTAVKTLGQLKSVGGYLYLQGTAVKTLGQLKSVGGYLDLEDTAVKTLGQLKSVGGSLNLRGTAVKTLGQLKSVCGYLDLEGTAVKLTDNIKDIVKGNIYR